MSEPLSEPVPVPVPDPALSAADWQELREYLLRKRADPVVRVLPELEITEERRDRFADSLFGGDPFTASFAAFGGKLSATFRPRLKWEIDLCVFQLGQDWREGLFPTDQSLEDAKRTYALRFQLVRLNGVDQDCAYPRKDKAMTLRRWTADSPIDALNEIKLTMLLGWLGQFDALLSRLEAEAADPANFIVPAAGV